MKCKQVYVNDTREDCTYDKELKYLVFFRRDSFFFINRRYDYFYPLMVKGFDGSDISVKVSLFSNREIDVSVDGGFIYYTYG